MTVMRLARLLFKAATWAALGMEVGRSGQIISGTDEGGDSRQLLGATGAG